MSKASIVGFTLLAMAGVSPAYAQTYGTTGYGQELPSQAELKAFNDRRIEIVKFALQLTPAQEKHWTAVEAAIRARGDARQSRLAKLATVGSESRERSAVDLLRDGRGAGRIAGE